MIKNKVSDGCVNCIYFDKFDVQKKTDNVIGACKANPPVPAPDYSESKLGVWPLVLGTFWCGVFNPIEEELKRKETSS